MLGIAGGREGGVGETSGDWVLIFKEFSEGYKKKTQSCDVIYIIWSLLIKEKTLDEQGKDMKLNW